VLPEISALILHTGSQTVPLRLTIDLDVIEIISMIYSDRIVGDIARSSPRAIQSPQTVLSGSPFEFSRVGEGLRVNPPSDDRFGLDSMRDPPHHDAEEQACQKRFTELCDVHFSFFSE
jgi:hypothetical protein